MKELAKQLEDEEVERAGEVKVVPFRVGDVVQVGRRYEGKVWA